jgi:hypothetical protein
VAGAPSRSLADLKVAERDLEMAALLCRLPRRFVLEYLSLAQAAEWQSRDDWQNSGGTEIDAGEKIDEDLARLTRVAAELVSRRIGHPRLDWWLRRRMGRAVTEVMALFHWATGTLVRSAGQDRGIIA